MRDRRSFFARRLPPVLLAALVGASTAISTQAPSTPKLHVLEITSGPAGTQSGGDFVFTEQRSVFSRTTDREVIVLFRWDGVPGPHKLVAQWRSPDGALSSSSSVDYFASDRRFGGYWRLPITPAMPLGTWTIEATVDGQPACRHTFELRDEKVEAAVTKRPLTRPELYERLNGVFVVLERSAPDGRQLDPAAGLLGNSSRVYTSLAAVDDTAGLRVIGPDGSRRSVSSVIGMDRQERWIVLANAQQHDVALPIAAPESVRVGDRCFSMEGAVAGGRVLTEGSITGQTEMPGAGRRLVANFATTLGTPGAPVMNEFGEVVGIIGGPPVAGATRLGEIERFVGQVMGTPVIPFTLLRVNDSASGEAISALQQRGELVAPLTGAAHVSAGGFARGVEKRGGMPIDQRDQFSVSDKTFMLFVAWRPLERLRGEVKFRAYDASNRPVIESPPGKGNYRKNQLTIAHWQIPVPRTAGWYRFDVLFDGRPVWRGFARVNE